MSYVEGVPSDIYSKIDIVLRGIEVMELEHFKARAKRSSNFIPYTNLENTWHNAWIFPHDIKSADAIIDGAASGIEPKFLGVDIMYLIVKDVMGCDFPSYRIPHGTESGEPDALDMNFFYFLTQSMYGNIRIFTGSFSGSKLFTDTQVSNVFDHYRHQYFQRLTTHRSPNAV